MKIDPRRQPQAAWKALAEQPSEALLDAIVEAAGELADRDQHGLVLAALALSPPRRYKVKPLFELLEKGEEPEEALLAIWQEAEEPAALLTLAALRYGWLLPPACRDLLLAELDIFEPDDEVALRLTSRAITRGVQVAPDLTLAGAPICTETLAAALTDLPKKTRDAALHGYADLLTQRGDLEELPDPADVHGLLIHDLLASPALGDTLLDAVAQRLRLNTAQAAARLLLATMRTAVDPHGATDYVARRAHGAGELVDGPMMRGFFEALQIDYQDTGLDQWALTLRYEDEIGAAQTARVHVRLTPRDAVVEWIEPIPTPTDPAWWPDLLHRSADTAPAAYLIDERGRLVLRAQQLREGFELAHLQAAWDALQRAITDLQS